ncbi:MAG TPA: DUF2804 family protein [Solirubrobacterales bacterium]|nr:DUF2804 family protein [Solirubrobacterales bacterium]
MAPEAIPWRGPGGDRPDLPLPPGPMPLRRDGQNRKRWRYVGVFGEELMLCAARAEIGPLTQSFWILWDRKGQRHDARTILRPGSREVRIDGPDLEIDSPDLRARLHLGECAPIESICPSDSGWGWTRKRAGMPIAGTVEVPGRRWEVEARGVDDESAGYHQRHTSWRWSAGVGSAKDGRAVAWNLVEGVNDPARNSERAIWVEDMPTEPPPSHFDGMAGIELPGGTLEFASESFHVRDENFLLFGSRYHHRFGSFSGSLGDLALAEGLGVMEEHDAVW